MLSTCHDRIKAQCATLRQLVLHLAARGANEEVRMAATSAVRFFSISVEAHHADEEENLFPALIESMAGSDAVCLQAIIDGLKADHRALDVVWRRLRRALERIAAGESVLNVSDDVEELVAMYERHILREESELFPMAARLLNNDELALIGRAMHKRREIDAM
jgi:hemerythrin-like domain-containing protein